MRTTKIESSGTEDQTEKKSKDREDSQAHPDGNPYQLNHAGNWRFGNAGNPARGIDRVRGHPQIAADPQLSTDYAVRLTLLRLLPPAKRR